jgi:hypothetical protein
MFECRIDYLEAARERDAQTPDYGGQLRRSFLAILQVEGRELGQTLQYRFELHPVVQAAKRMNVLLQPLVIGRS